jgi:hypothetical protein
MDCHFAVTDMLAELDFDMIFPESASMNAAHKELEAPMNFLFIAFKSDLFELLQTPSTSDYLDRLLGAFNEYLLGKNNQLNLWQVTLDNYGSSVKAARVIAALFQDTTSKKLHIAYLDKTYPNMSQSMRENRDRLDRLIDTMIQASGAAGDKHHELFYPKDAAKGMNPGLYHYYVPLRLAYGLKSLGTNSSMSFIAPFFMTLSYEAITSAEDYRYVFKDPATINNAWKIKDLFSCIQGSAKGSGEKNQNSLHKISDLFQASTLNAVKAIIKN